MSTTFRSPAPDEQALLASLQVRLLEPAELARCSQLLDQYHYLKSPKPVGERLYYVVTDRQGQWKAACALPSIATSCIPAAGRGPAAYGACGIPGAWATRSTSILQAWVPWEASARRAYGERGASVLPALCIGVASARLGCCFRILFVFSWCFHGVLPLGSSPTFRSIAASLVGFLPSAFFILSSAV